MNSESHTSTTEPNVLRDQLQLVTDFDNNVNDIIWTLFAIFFPANGVFLLALFQSGDFPKPPVGAIISLAAALMSLAWALFHRRVLAHKERFEALIKRTEEDLRIPPQYCTSPKINTADWDKYVAGKRPGARQLLLASTWGSFALWTLAFLIFLCLWYHTT